MSGCIDVSGIFSDLKVGKRPKTRAYVPGNQISHRIPARTTLYTWYTAIGFRFFNNSHNSSVVCTCKTEHITVHTDGAYNATSQGTTTVDSIRTGLTETYTSSYPGSQVSDVLAPS